MMHKIIVMCILIGLCSLYIHMLVGIEIYFVLQSLVCMYLFVFGLNRVGGFIHG